MLKVKWGRGQNLFFIFHLNKKKLLRLSEEFIGKRPFFQDRIAMILIWKRRFAVTYQLQQPDISMLSRIFRDQ